MLMSLDMKSHKLKSVIFYCVTLSVTEITLINDQFKRHGHADEKPDVYKG